MNWVTTSSRLYAELLRLYPKRFREAYGDELQLVFRDCARDGYRRGGGWEVCRVWLGVLPDLFLSAAEQHAEEDLNVSLKILIGMLAGAGLIGGALWILASVLILLRPEGASAGINRDVGDLLPLFFVGVQLFSMGLIGIFLLPGRDWSAPYRVLVLIAAVGGLVTSGLWQFQTNDANWSVLMAGILVQSACIALVGIGLLRRSVSRTWGLLLLALAVAQLLSNFEDWRAVFLAVAGAVVMGLMVLIFRKAPGPNLGTPAMS